MTFNIRDQMKKSIQRLPSQMNATQMPNIKPNKLSMNIDKAETVKIVSTNLKKSLPNKDFIDMQFNLSNKANVRNLSNKTKGQSYESTMNFETNKPNYRNKSSAIKTRKEFGAMPQLMNLKTNNNLSLKGHIANFQ